jgi:hypothetical protein
MRKLLASSVTALLFASVHAAPASACGESALVVTSKNDSGPGSLRAAITAANACPAEQPAKIHFSIPGAGIQPIYLSSTLPEIGHKTTIDGTKQPGYAGSPLVELRGEFVAGSGLLLKAEGCEVRGLLIDGFRAGAGIRIEANGAVVEECYIGAAIDSTGGQRNSIGILILAASCRVGGREAHNRNIIGGNYNGVVISGTKAKGNVVEGNHIGTDASGTRYVSNQTSGVSIVSGASDNTIGGDDPSARNVISGQAVGTGVSIGTPETSADPSPSGNIVRGNYIGMDATGTVAVNNDRGVLIYKAANTKIGGPLPHEGNLISGSYGDAVVVSDSTAVVIQGNSIGVAADGVSPVESGNGSGISVGGAKTDDVLIGGTFDDAGNTIAHAHRHGVNVVDGSGVVISGNSIYSNGGLGIREQTGLAPSLSSVLVHGGGTTVTGSLDFGAELAGLTYSVELFSNVECDLFGAGEGKTYLGSTSARLDGNGHADFTFEHHVAVDASHVITATATPEVGNTSAFSECAGVTALFSKL